MKKGTEHTGPMETLDAFHQKMKITKLVNAVQEVSRILNRDTWREYA